MYGCSIYDLGVIRLTTLSLQTSNEHDATVGGKDSNGGCMNLVLIKLTSLALSSIIYVIFSSF